MKFEVTEKQEADISVWLAHEVYPRVIAEQKKSKDFMNNPFAQSCWEMGYPYEGAIGGGLTYSFSPTGLGDVLIVRYKDYELNVTDYYSW